MENYGYESDKGDTNDNGRPYTISGGNNLTTASNAYLVGVNSRFKPSKKLQYYQRSALVLLILVILLLIVMTVILVLFTKSLHRQKICTTNECLKSAANFKYSIDFDADPCENFYQYTCGKWSQEHPNHGWYTSYSTFSTIGEKISIEIMRILSSEIDEKDPVPVNQAKYFYESCLDQDSVDQLGLTVMYKYLEQVGLPAVPNFLTNNDSDFDWIASETMLKQIFAMDVLIGFNVQPNIFKRNQNVIYLGTLYQQCPLPSPFKLANTERKSKSLTNQKHDMQDTDNKDKHEKKNTTINTSDEEYKKAKTKLKNDIRGKMFQFIVKEVMKNNSMEIPDELNFKSAIEIVNQFTNFLDEITDNYTIPESDINEEDTKSYTFQQLQEKTKNNVSKIEADFWVKYLDALFENTNVTLDVEKDLLFVADYEMGYLFDVLNYVSELPASHVELYFWWSTVYSMIANTAGYIVEEISDIAAVYYGENDANIARSRALDCSDLVNQYMGLAVSYAFADRSFPNKTQPKVEKMINDIKEAFVEHVKKINWMDSHTKKVTLDKSKEMMSFIGYPDWLFKERALERHFEGLEINSTTYLDNMINIIKLFVNESLTSLRLENKRDWKTEPINVNAFNSFMDNAINVPIGILNHPMYNLGLEVLNYGSIGAIIGHELTHGFDNTGRKHDKYGNYRQWWSNQTSETFENMTQCFIKQYDNFTIDGVEGHVNGKATLGENLADNGGLNQAFTAYRNFINKFGEEPKLPGFEHFSSDQMFFIAYGSIWCEASNLEDLKDQLETDEHCPNAIRVVGVLQNSEDFAKAFRCPKGSFMNPEVKKCQIW